MMLLPKNHRQSIVKEALSLDGKYVLPADWNTIILWEVFSGNSITLYNKLRSASNIRGGLELALSYKSFLNMNNSSANKLRCPVTF